ncbi:MAG: glycosyltransferase family 4 protein [Leeuwenhoekiella sp.]
MNNILMLHSSSDLYGGSKILLLTVSIFQKQGHSPIVVLDSDGPLKSKLEEKNITVYILELGILRRQYFNFRGLLNRVSALVLARKNLQKLVFDHNIDTVYSNTTGVLVGAYLTSCTKLKHIWHVHEIIKKPRFFSSFIGWHLEKFADEVIVVSHEVKKHWVKHVDASKIKVIYNGLNHPKELNAPYDLAKELQVKRNTLLIGMVGRVNLWKGQSYFIEVASILSRKFDDIKFIMVGDAYQGYEYLYEELKDQKKKLNMENRIFDLGYRTDIDQIMSGLDIFVLPSIQPDPLPTVVLEAMGLGKPVVATAHGGALEMIEDGKTGCLIPWENAVEAAMKISSLIEDKKLREEIGLNARARALKYFSHQRYEANILKIL